MENTGTVPGAEPPTGTWKREAGVLWLLLFVFAAYFSRAGSLPLRGEEPTRAQVAFEMVQGHDWLIPRQQGQPFRIRPPFQNYLIATSCLAFGNWDPWAVRFPSLLATLLTTLLVYAYARTFLTPVGALAAGLAFATFPDAFQMGRQAETEALFVFLLSASLLTWHLGLLRRWPDAWSFAAGYALMALAMLTKGIQAPTYFVGSLGVYLVLTRDWRRLFSPAHALGILVGLAVLSTWVVPYARVMGWSEIRCVFLGDPAVTINSGISHWEIPATLRHLLVYPLEIAAGTLPWCLSLLLFAFPSFRKGIRSARPQVLFLGICLGLAFPSCWIPPGGLPRYFFPLFPCMAVLIGLGIERTATAPPGSTLRLIWQRYQLAVASVMLLTAVFLVGLHAVGPRLPALAPLVEPPLLALGYTIAAITGAVLILRNRLDIRTRATQTCVLALTGFLVLTVNGLVMDVRIRRCEDAAVAMRQVKGRLPQGQRLDSLGGDVDSLFTYLYGMPLIAAHPWPTTDPRTTRDLDYFCFEACGNERPLLPFAWEEVGVVPLDRNHHPVPERLIVVGHRLPGQGPASPDPLRAQALLMPGAVPRTE